MNNPEKFAHSTAGLIDITLIIINCNAEGGSDRGGEEGIYCSVEQIGSSL